MNTQKSLFYTLIFSLISFVSCKTFPGWQDKKEPGLDPHLAAIGPHYQFFAIDPSKDNQITAGGGVRLNIAADSIALPDNFKAGDKVDISMQEVIHPFDFANTSASLNHTTEDGGATLFESAGMVDVKAKYITTPLQLKPGKKITMQFPNILEYLKSNIR